MAPTIEIAAVAVAARSGPASIEGSIISIRLTAYQIKLRIEGGHHVTLWKRRFIGQWGGTRIDDGSLNKRLCEACGDADVPVLAPGVHVVLTLDPSHNIGRTVIHCVASMSTPGIKDISRMRAYASHVAAWATTASKDMMEAHEHRLVAETVKRLLMRGSEEPVERDYDYDMGSCASSSASALRVARTALTILSDAVHRVNIRANLELDGLSVQGGVSPSELDNLAASILSYARFRVDPFVTTVLGGGGAARRPLFKTLDSLAIVYGISVQRRRTAAVVYKLHLLLADGGHSCCPAADLISSPLLHWTCEDVRLAILEGVSSGVLRQDALGGSDVYLAHTHAVEISVGMRIAKLCKGGAVTSWSARVRDEGFRDSVRELLSGNGQGTSARSDLGCSQLDDVQRGAVWASLTGEKDLLILCGYPGTGKSRVSQAIQRVCEALGLVVLVCAPTAKAASRLGHGATTVHRALGAQPYGEGDGKFRFGHNERCPLCADLVLVDEVSMLDMSITHALLRACGSQRTRLVFVGDVNQLPSVEWGNVLGSLMDSQCVPCVFLERIYRQQGAEDASKPDLNTIWPLAKSIAEGGPLLRADLRSETVTWSTDDSLSGVSAALMALRSEHGNKLQIISPSRRHGLHTVLLNEMILDRPTGRWDTKFEVGDRIVVTKNQTVKSKTGKADLSGQSPLLMNGDCGTVVEVGTSATEGRRIGIRLDDDRIGSIAPSDLDHAYALTTHKAQGSEYEVVAVVLSNQHGKALNRQALYTSVSRAVKRLFIFASRETLGTCVNTISERRMGHLAERIHFGVTE